MENRNKRIFLTAGWLLGCLAPGMAQAQDEAVQVIDPDLERRTVETPAIDTENFEVGGYYGVISIEDFSSSEVLGIRAAYHVTEDFFFEANYGMAEGDQTSFERLSGGVKLLSDEDREYNYYNVNIGWNFLPGEIFLWDRFAFNTQVYAIVGVGNTQFAGDDWFTLNFGTGLRMALTDWFAWHLDVRDHIFDRDTFGEDQTTHNLEIHTGFTLFF